jgi:hypothetical protein
LEVFQNSPIIIKGLSQDELPYKLYRVKNPDNLVLKKEKTSNKRGRDMDSGDPNDFFILDAPPFAAFLYLDQALQFGDNLYKDEYMIIDESPYPECNESNDKNSADYSNNLLKAIKNAKSN